MVTKKWALVFGVVFILLGVLGYVPAALTTSADGMHKLLLGVFVVDNVHNIIHLASGAVALIAAMASAAAARLYFQIFGIVYALVNVVGFIQRDTVLGIFHVNMADNILHLVIAVTALAIGFGVKERTSKVAGKKM